MVDMIEEIIGSRSKVSILKVLYNTDRTLTIREISIKAGVPYSVTYKDITIFSKLHVVLLKKQLNRTLVKLICSNNYIRKLRPVFEGELSHPKKMFTNKRALIMIHSNADPDALGSAIALARGLYQSGMHCEIISPQGISRQSKAILDKYPYPILTEVKNYPKLIFIIDTSSPEQLGNPDFPADAKIILIDHHSPGKLAQRATFSIIDPDSRSCSRLVHDFLMNAGVNLTKEIAFFLAAGLVADTAFLKFAQEEDIIYLHRLLEFVTLNEIFNILNASSCTDFSERVVRAKAMPRIDSYRIGDLIVSFTKVGSFESQIANFLIRSFSDIAIVENIQSKNEVRISGRARKHLEGMLDLSSVFQIISKDIDGNCGGHDLAAGANGTNSDNMKLVRRKLISSFEKIFSLKAKAI